MVIKAFREDGFAPNETGTEKIWLPAFEGGMKILRFEYATVLQNLPNDRILK